jgi:Lon protease-like protein
MHEGKVKDEHLERLAIFPLGQAVLFPGTKLPLHIFEPRYRQMVEHAIERQTPIAMALLDPTRGPDEHGRPAVHSVAGVGMIESHERLPDGRFLMVLNGFARVRIVEEHDPNTLYREVRAELLPDVIEDQAAVDDKLATLQNLTFSIRLINPRVADFLASTMGELDDPGRIADSVANVLFLDPDDRQRLLETQSVADRLEVVSDRVTEILAMASASEGDALN